MKKMVLAILLSLAAFAAVVAEIYDVKKLMSRTAEREKVTEYVLELYPTAISVPKGLIRDTAIYEMAKKAAQLLNAGEVEKGDLYAFDHLIGQRYVTSFVFFDYNPEYGLTVSDMIIFFPFDY